MKTVNQGSNAAMPDRIVINAQRLLGSLEELARIGRTPQGACCRLALTEEDRLGRDWVIAKMKALGLTVTVDEIGNIFGLRQGQRPDLAPVMTGSHIDTVRTGGDYDGNLGVLAGLEVIASLDEARIDTSRGLVVAVFTNEEGARFAPDMLGSLVYAGAMDVDDALKIKSIDGAILGDALREIGYAGQTPVGHARPCAFVELHIEQGPVLDTEGIQIGVVRDLQGISWQQVVITGQSNHAGTTPMAMRHDAGYAACEIACFVRQLARQMQGTQVATVGRIDLTPNLINVIASRAELTVDLRNTDETLLQQAESKVSEFMQALSEREGVRIQTKTLARFEPVKFDDRVADRIAHHAKILGLSSRSMTSGAGHDAQMLARVCQSAMIFVPSVKGISHNPAEHTEPEDLVAGANVLLATLYELANQEG